MSRWMETTAQVYRTAYQRWGGSVWTAPGFVESVSSLCDQSLQYLAGYDENDRLRGVVPRWGSYPFGAHEAVTHPVSFARGQMEIILPLDREYRHTLPPGLTYLSSFHEGSVEFAARDANLTQMLLRVPDLGGGLSHKFVRRQRYQYNRLKKAGGRTQAVQELPVSDFVELYRLLHEKRWNKEPFGYATLQDFLSERPELRAGYVLYLKNTPIAVQYLLMSECDGWVSVEYLNGGFDPQYIEYSPGSVLYYANTQEMLRYAQSRNKGLRYSFGTLKSANSESYKLQWCHRLPNLWITTPSERSTYPNAEDYPHPLKPFGP